MSRNPTGQMYRKWLENFAQFWDQHEKGENREKHEAKAEE